MKRRTLFLSIASGLAAAGAPAHAARQVEITKWTSQDVKLYDPTTRGRIATLSGSNRPALPLKGELLDDDPTLVRITVIRPGAGPSVVLVDRMQTDVNDPAAQPVGTAGPPKINVAPVGGNNLGNRKP